VEFRTHHEPHRVHGKSQKNGVYLSFACLLQEGILKFGVDLKGVHVRKIQNHRRLAHRFWDQGFRDPYRSHHSLTNVQTDCEITEKDQKSIDEKGIHLPFPHRVLIRGGTQKRS